MGLAFSVVLVLFILPIVLGVFFLFRIKKLGIILLCIPFVVTVLIVGWWVYELNHHFVASTDLNEENIDNIGFKDDLNIADLTDKYGAYEMGDNVYFPTFLQFENINIGANDEKEVVYLRTEDPNMQTSKGIAINDPLEDVFSLYGENYYKYSEMGRDDSINYVDRDLRLHIQFWYRDDRVVRISFTEM